MAKHFIEMESFSFDVSSTFTSMGLILNKISGNQMINRVKIFQEVFPRLFLMEMKRNPGLLFFAP